MAMTLAQMKVNRGTWHGREVFRHNRWSYWHNNNSRGTASKRNQLRGKWWNLYVEARDKRAWYDHEIARKQATVSPSGLGTFDGHVVAGWMIPRLYWYRAHGWTGSVVSGYRSPAHQMEAAINYARQLGRSLYSVYPSGPLASNHCRYVYPGGAVDVTNYSQLAQVIRNHPYPGGKNFEWAGPTIGDYVHFSANGH